MGDDDMVELSDAIGVFREQLVAAQLAGRRVVRAGVDLRCGQGVGQVQR
ncbi:MAG: hypothetical protein ACRDRK_02150 [Pseudonocardia sp.]